MGLRDKACVREYEKAVALKRGLTLYVVTRVKANLVWKTLSAEYGVRVTVTVTVSDRLRTCASSREFT